MTLGGAVLGLPLSVAGYYLAHSAIVRYRNQIKPLIVHEREKLARKALIRQRQKKKRRAKAK